MEITKTKSPKLVIILIAIIIIVLTVGLLFLTGKSSSSQEKETTKTEKENNQSFQVVTAEFPTSGQGYATMEKPIKAYLNPLRSHTVVLGAGHTKFVLVSDTNIFYFCACKKPDTTKTGKIEEWWKMPAGNYLVYPNGKDEIMFSWQQ